VRWIDHVGAVRLDDDPHVGALTSLDLLKIDAEAAKLRVLEGRGERSTPTSLRSSWKRTEEACSQRSDRGSKALGMMAIGSSRPEEGRTAILGRQPMVFRAEWKKTRSSFTATDRGARRGCAAWRPSRRRRRTFRSYTNIRCRPEKPRCSYSGRLNIRCGSNRSRRTDLSKSDSHPPGPPRESVDDVRGARGRRGPVAADAPSSGRTRSAPGHARSSRYKGQARRV
jgi:hypothetical protein